MTVGIEPFVQAEASVAWNQWLALFYHQVVQAGARLAANFENVFETRRRYERDASASPLKQRVCADRRATSKVELLIDTTV